MKPVKDLFADIFGSWYDVETLGLSSALRLTPLSVLTLYHPWLQSEYTKCGLF